MMPISAKENAKVERHVPSETIDGDMMYSTPGKFSVPEAIRSGVAAFSKNTRYSLLSIPDAVVVSITIYLIATLPGAALNGPFNAASFFSQTTLTLETIVGFFLYFIFISAPLSSFYKSRIAKMKYPGTLKAIAGSLSTVQPLGYALFIAGIALTFTAVFTNRIGSAALIIGAILYLTSINQSMLPYFLADTKNNRSNAIGYGWLLLSNSTIRLVSTDLIIFLPVIVLLAIYFATQNQYLLALDAIVFLVSEGVWYGATSFIHKEVSKIRNNYNIA